ncbi:signal peptidase I [Mycoplasmopsis gallopavonis]|nr:signal peptidase I [Mycoplasmopsis gallopavonis]
MQAQTNYWKKNKKKIIIFSFLTFFILCLFLIFFFFSIIKIKGQSMEPLLKNGAIKLAIKKSNYKKGDFIIFKENDLYLVKMLVAKEGDHLIISNNHLFVNNIDLSHLFQGDFGDDLELIIPQKQAFVLGVNLNFSYDSRNFGLIELSRIESCIIL